MLIVPGYYPFRTLGRFNNTGRKLELIREKIETFFFECIKVERTSKCGNHSLWNQFFFLHFTGLGPTYPRSCLVREGDLPIRKWGILGPL